MRLDIFVTSVNETYNRSTLQKLITNGSITVNNSTQKAGYKLKFGDEVEINEPNLKHDEADKINLPILYEDDDCLVLDKPEGILSHSKGVFNDEQTVATFIADKLTPGFSGERAGIVHRLDRATSGVIICAKNPEASKWLQKQFSDRRVKKTYQAITTGIPKEMTAIIDRPIERNPKKPQTFRTGPNGKTALTPYEVIKVKDNHSLITLTPTTGRTHQLRVHLKSINCPIVGDFFYGEETADRMYLHALKLELTLPSRERVTFESKLPSSFTKFMS